MLICILLLHVVDEGIDNQQAQPDEYLPACTLNEVAVGPAILSEPVIQGRLNHKGV